MSKLNGLEWLVLILVIIGALNWGLVGIFKFDLVAALFNGAESGISRVIYTLVGLSGVYLIFMSAKLSK